MADIVREEGFSTRGGVRFFRPDEQIGVQSGRDGALSFSRGGVNIRGIGTAGFMAERGAEGLEVGEHENLLIVTSQGIYKGRLNTLSDAERKLLFIAQVNIDPYLPHIMMCRLEWPVKTYSAECRMEPVAQGTNPLDLRVAQISNLWTPLTPLRDLREYRLVVPADIKLLYQLEFTFRERI